MQKSQKPTKQQKVAKVNKKVVKTPKRKLTTKKLNALKAPFSLPALPFDSKACEPHMSAELFSYHHGKHHNTYVNNLNNFVKDTPMATQTLEELIDTGSKLQKEGKPAIFNNAAQHFNHSFFWKCLTPEGGANPKGALAKQIDADFGSFDKFRDAFKANAVGHFGSGWAFLTYDKKNKKLAIESHHDASTPQVNGTHAIFTVDVWEHSYYIDTRNDRAKYVDTVMTKLANWDFAAENFAEATADV